MLAVMLWPFLTLALLRKRVTSPAVTAAALVPLALSLAAMWYGFSEIMWGMAKGGGIASISAGLADSLLVVGFGAGSALAVFLLGAFKRHWPAADAMTLILAIDIAALFTAAVGFAAAIDPARRDLALVASALSLAVALALIAWFVLVSRGRVVSQHLRFAIVPVLLVVVAIFLVARYEANRYFDIARHGVRR